ncbi:hypothetical protein BJV82DRAFT_617900 [Fennellomyces sp. T-0311]|nr:hypothetical protein BJV82DRAFT_617900 [Fennellomyces sp. T-0311]
MKLHIAVLFSIFLLVSCEDENDGSMFFSPSLLTNTTLLYVTAILSALVWSSGYVIEYMLDRQEQLELEKCVSAPSYGSVDISDL